MGPYGYHMSFISAHMGPYGPFLVQKGLVLTHHLLTYHVTAPDPRPPSKLHMYLHDLVGRPARAPGRTSRAVWGWRVHCPYQVVVGERSRLLLKAVGCCYMVG